MGEGITRESSGDFSRSLAAARALLNKSRLSSKLMGSMALRTKANPHRASASDGSRLMALRRTASASVYSFMV